ncbi:MAG: response regulator [Porticoccaceae bacterium]
MKVITTIFLAWVRPRAAVVDAYTQLKTDAFDLLLSDIDMPKMDGFDLTTRIRADRQLSRLPVVLVTSLGSATHRQCGIDAGADAYIIKDNLDQRGLVATIDGLIGRHRHPRTVAADPG